MQPSARTTALACALLAVTSGSAGAQGAAAGSQGRQVAPEQRKAPPVVATGALDFGLGFVGGSIAPQTVTLENQSDEAATIESVALNGSGAGAYSLVAPPPFPLALAPSAQLDLEVQFAPAAPGQMDAVLAIDVSPDVPPEPTVLLTGLALGAPGDEVRMNAGGPEYVAADGTTWSAEYGVVGGAALPQPGPVGGTPDPILYQDQRQGKEVLFELPLPDAPYRVTMGFAELQATGAGQRVFDVLADRQVVVDDLDVFAAAGMGQAHTETFEVDVSDGVLPIRLEASVGAATVSWIRVEGLPRLDASTTDVQFGAVASQSSATRTVDLASTGAVPATIDSIAFLLGPAGTPDAMSAELFGDVYAGEPSEVSYAVGESVAAGDVAPLALTFAPATDQYDQCTLRLEGDFGTLDLTLSGLGGHEGHPYLHPVIETAATLVDYDADGVEEAFLDGSLSHTHEPGASLVAHEWTEGGSPLASGPVVTVPLALGPHVIQLEITDDNLPPESLATTADVEVVGSDEVPGVLVEYHDASQGGETPGGLLNDPPDAPDFAEVVPGTFVDGLTTIGGSPFAKDVMVRMLATIDLPAAGTYELAATGGSQRLILLNGLGVVGPVALEAGEHDLDVRFAVDGAGQVPLEVQLGVDGGELGPIDEAWLDHDESTLAPLITSMPVVGTSLGGNEITIEGLGFFPEDAVTVHWGGTPFSGAALDAIAADELVLTSPPGSGTISVTIETPNGTSNAVDYTYDPSGPVPINFDTVADVPVNDPTAGTWAPDGRFYVAGLDGRITAFEFDDDYGVVSETSYDGVSNLSNYNVLGVTVSPWDPPSPVRLYVAHGEHFVNGGSTFEGPSPYTGQVSILEGPNFDTPIPLITQLPTSNHDHAVNGLVFDNNGDLLICVGSNTNAGVKHPNSGDLVESPLSAAIVKARTSKDDFNGAIQYLLSASGVESTDQVDGEIVDVAPGVDVEVFAAGLRNPYDLVYTTKGRVFATDNGPNPGFGAASTSMTTESPDPWDKDEVDRIEYGGYYGSPNRSRGRYDERQAVYRNGTEPSIPGEFTQALALLNSSIDGIDEYRAATFQSQMRGDLIAQKMGSVAYRIELGTDGAAVESVTQVTTWSGALGLETLPGGAICALAQGLDYLRIFVPDDLSAVGIQVHDVTPWRGPETGGTPFVIGGVGFQPGAQVLFDGVPATVTEVSSTRIHGVTPPVPDHGGELVDVEVKVGPSTVFLTDGFRFLYPPGGEPGDWTQLPDAPTFLGEVASGVIDGILYLVGSGGGGTYRYDLGAGAWIANAAPRPFPGDHHACEVVAGKLYLFGGLEAGAEGKVQIFDPETGLWSLGTDMPWAAGSVATGVLDGKVHVAGGIVGRSTVANHAVYDPEFDAWTTKAPLPVGRNHAAACGDGERFWVVGGRDGDNVVSNGFDDVQVYDPASDTWEWSDDGVSDLAPLPQARGGMGTAVWFQNEIYVFGGETLDGPGAVAGNVYDRVDVYDPEENAWRLDEPMPNPRHGIYPVPFGSRIYLACGGPNAGTSGSNVFDAFERP